MTSARARPESSEGKSAPRPVPRLSLGENLTGLRKMRHDQISFLVRSVNDHGDIFRMRLGGLPAVMVNHPDYLQRVLVDNHQNYDKGNFLYDAARTVMRDGLLANTGGESWRVHRKIMSPSFTRSSVSRFTHNISDLTSVLLRQWETNAREGTLVEVTTDVANLALRIVLRTLFGVDADDRGRQFERDFLEVNAIVGKFFRFPFPPLSWKSPMRNRLRVLLADMDAYIEYLIDERMAKQSDDPDLFTLLLNAVDEETGTGLTHRQLANEVLSTIIGGYETTSNTIAWIFHQLAVNPDMQARVHDEVDGVLGGRVPTFEDLPKLPYTRMVIDETLRLFTPGWQTMRRAVEEDVIGDYRIPKGTNIYLNLFTFHRHPEFWPDPYRFDPERFTPEEIAKRPRNVYLPFSSGPRHCIGKHFALAELHIITTMLAQTFHVTRPAELPPVGFEPLLTLHPKGGIQLLLQRR
ncbi:cytochrome P450 [Nocardia transvalensis]|uniref:cytochrome P450 n=1 Tax=Nocardia transvalensis TaxID=37333 RepID=UPI001895C6B6|nr:cytochrome P450 [Nocardia transvalensis]MBF6328274.1 cytochrome P450 [Nocardia transvalensis]